VRPTPALLHLRRHADGLLAAAGRIEPVRFIIDPASGHPVMAVQPDLVDCDAITLHVPDDDDRSLQMLGAPLALDPAVDARCDRFLIHLGTPKGRHQRAWILLTVEQVRFMGDVIDAAQVVQPNPFASREPAACRTANADLPSLRRACRAAGADVESPALVGLDPLGADLRAPFGIVRIEWPDAPIQSVESALAHLASPA
jgi:hypothetical protein